MKEFNDTYEQEENITLDDNDKNTDFGLCECFDIGIDNVKGEQEGGAVSQNEVGTHYEDSDEFRSLPNDNKAKVSSGKRKNECWLNLQLIWMIQSSI